MERQKVLYTESEIVGFCQIYADAEMSANLIRKTKVKGAKLSENNRLFYGIILQKYIEKVPESIRKKLNINEKSLLEELCKK